MSARLGVDFDGTLLSTEVESAASKEWFSYMSEVLCDPAVAAYDLVEWYAEMLRVMERVEGKKASSKAIEESFLVKARDSFSRIYLEILSHHPEMVNQEMVAWLRTLKHEGNSLALISSTPESIVVPALALLGILDLFDIVLAAPPERYMRKREQLETFLARYGMLERYFGDSDGDRRACEALGIPFEKV